MANTILLIALSEDLMADVRWGRVGETSCRFGAHLDLTEGGGELAAMAQGSRVVVLVPARHVALRQTTFQGKARQATPLALAFAHEAGLLADAEQMHWAVLDKAQRDFTLAGVALTQMQEWVERLSASGIRADKMLPDVLALPLPGQCSALHWRNHWLIRTGSGQGMQLPDAWLGCASLPTPDWCLHRGGEVPAGWEAARIDEDPLWRLAEEAWNSTFTLLQGTFQTERTLAAPPARQDRLRAAVAQRFAAGGRFASPTDGPAEREPDCGALTAPAAGSGRVGVCRAGGESAGAAYAGCPECAAAVQAVALRGRGARVMGAPAAARRWLSTPPTIVWW